VNIVFWCGHFKIKIKFTHLKTPYKVLDKIKIAIKKIASKNGKFSPRFFLPKTKMSSNNTKMLPNLKRLLHSDFLGDFF
jgi:hypothetical protein